MPSIANDSCVAEPFPHEERIKEQLKSSEYEAALDAATLLKNTVIGSNKQKKAVIQHEFVPRLLKILTDNNQGDPSREQLLLETMACLASLAKGSEDEIRYLINAGCLPIFTQAILEPRSSPRYLEIVLKALRSLYNTTNFQVEPITHFDRTEMLVTKMLNLAATNSFSNQECVALVLSRSCQYSDNQKMLLDHGAVNTIGNLLVSPCYKVQLAALDWLAQLCFQNELVAREVVRTLCRNEPIPEILTQMMGQDRQVTMQLYAAKCMAYLYRAGAICPEDKRIVYKTLPTLIRICKNQSEPELRPIAAEYLAYLTQVDTFLQQTASNCDHIIPALANMLKFQGNSISLSTISFTNHGYTSMGHLTPFAMRKFEADAKLAVEMKQAAFKAFASLGANDEEIRKKIIETDMLMDHIINGLSDHNVKTRLAALTCLHSLSRSVQQLKTTFQDHTVWVPLRNLLHNGSDDVLTVASSTLCNLLLEFSNSKQHFLDRSSMELLCGLTRREETALRLNGVWALMNMAYQADQNVKIQILNTLGTHQIFHLLADQDLDVVLKTLGLLRNLLAHKPHIDHIMTQHGKEIIDALILLLDGSDSTVEVKEQALCIFANIASGESARELIMQHTDLLKRLTDYLKDDNVKLQLAAAFCFNNLALSDEEGAMERQACLRNNFNVHNILQQMLNTNDTALYERVKNTLHQFNNGEN